MVDRVRKSEQGMRYAINALALIAASATNRTTRQDRPRSTPTSVHDWSDTLSKTETAALTLALETLRTSRRAAMFASYCCQMDSLHLKPNQIPPMYVTDPNNPDEGRGPQQAGLDGRYEAAALLRHILAAGVSRYHPDPGAALAEVERIDL